VTLNRVTGQSISRIDGSLLANGRVFLLNPNGVLVGRSGVVDTGGFTASTLDLSNENFLSGGDLRFQGTSTAGVVNLGSINAVEGDVFLIASSVLNEGTISARNGSVGLAAGNDVLIAESGSERVFVRGAGAATENSGVINQGTVNANIAELKSFGGNIYGMAVKNEGRVAATGVSREGGQIFLRAGGGRVRSSGTLTASKPDEGGEVTIDSGTTGTTEISGTVDVGSDSGRGGEIVILGNEIDLLESSLIIADGDSGGGRILIGGGRRGLDPGFNNALNVTVHQGATIQANGVVDGNGGEIIVFASDTLDFTGSISATGGALGGDGGFIELSGKKRVLIPDLASRANLSASNGRGGTLLFDPTDIEILSGIFMGEGPPDLSSGSTSASVLYADDISTFLSSGFSLVIESDSNASGDGDITLRTGASILWETLASLSFNAAGTFAMEGTSTIMSGDPDPNNLVPGGNISIFARGVRLEGGMIGSVGGEDAYYGNLTIAPIDPSLAINLGVGAENMGLQLTHLEIGKLADGFSSISIGDADWGYGKVTINAVTFTDPITIATPYGGDDEIGEGEIHILGDLIGTGDASITLNGAGPAFDWEGTATTYLWADIVTEGQMITIDDDLILKANARLDTTARGNVNFLTGADVSIYGTVTSESIESFPSFGIDAGTNGSIDLQDTVGVSEFGIGGIDFDAADMELNHSLSSRAGIDIKVQRNFSLNETAFLFAQGDIKISANQGDPLTAGDFPGMEINSGIISENGSIELSATGGESEEDGDGNRGVWIRAGEGLEAKNDITIIGRTLVDTDLAAAIVIDAEVNSLTGKVELRSNGGDILVNRSVFANSDEVSEGDGRIDFFGSATEGTTFLIQGDLGMDEQDITFTGGAALDDRVSFAGSSAEWDDVEADQFAGIEFLIGNFTEEGDFGDYFYGSATQNATFTFTGGDTFDYRDDGNQIRVSGFEFVFGESGEDAFVGADSGATFNFTSGDEFEYSDTEGFIVTGIGFQEVFGGDGDDEFKFEEYSYTDSIFGGGGYNTVNFSSFDDNIYVDLALAWVQGDRGDYGGEDSDEIIYEFGGIDEFIGASGADYNELYGSNYDDTVKITGSSGGSIEYSEPVGEGLFVAHKVDFSGFNYIDTWDGNDEFIVGMGETYLYFNGSLSGGRGDDIFRMRSGWVREIDGGSYYVDGNDGYDTIDYSLGSYEDISVDYLGNVDYYDYTGYGEAAGGYSTGVDDFFQINEFIGGSGNSVDSGFYGTSDADEITITGPSGGFLEYISAIGIFHHETDGASFVVETTKVDFSGFNDVYGSEGDDTFYIDVAQSGSLGPKPPIFSGVLNGGNGDDTFVFRTGMVSEIIGGKTFDYGGGFETSFFGGELGGGPEIEDPENDLLDFSELTDDLTVDLVQFSALTDAVFVGAPGTYQGPSGASTFSGIESVTGGGGENTLKGTAMADEISVSGDGSGTITFEAEGYAGGGGGLALASFAVVPFGGEGPPFPGGNFEATLAFEEFREIDAGGGEDVFSIKLPTETIFSGTLAGGAGEDNFLISRGGSVGEIDGGSEVDTLDYSGFSTPVSFRLDTASATQLESFSSIESVIGGAAEDTLTGTNEADLFQIVRDGGGFLNSGEFDSFEILRGQGGNDRFVFLNQGNVSRIEGGADSDTFTLDDSTLGGTNTYVISGNSVSRNPFYQFSEMEFLQFFLGPGNDTVFVNDNGLIQILNGGAGNDTINFGSAPVVGRAPFILGGSQVFQSQFENFIFVQDESSNPENIVTPAPDGGGEQGPGTLVDQFTNTSGFGNNFGAFAGSALIAGQAIVLQVEGGQVEAPLSLDGFFTLPPPEVVGSLSESLEVDAWAELANAIDFGGATILVRNDGPYSVSLDGVPPNEIVELLQQLLQMEPAGELFEALEMTIVLPITAADGAISILAVPVQIEEAVFQQLIGNLDGAAFSELTSALDG